METSTRSNLAIPMKVNFTSEERILRDTRERSTILLSLSSPVSFSLSLFSQYSTHLFLFFTDWTVEGNAGVNGKISNTAAPMIMDTGTTLVIAPPEQATEFYKNVPSAKKWKDSFYIYKCSEEWEATFEFNGQQFTVPSKYTNLGLTAKGSEWCVSGIASQDMGLGDNWLVGGVFLRYATLSLSFSPRYR